MVSDFDYRGIPADDEATLRGLATEIGRVEQAESESWLMDLAPKYAEARRILRKATGRQFGKRWGQWLALQPTGGKSRTGDKLAKAHDLVESWRLIDAERAIIVRYRSVVCDLAAPTMPKEIQEEFRPRLLAGEDVTRNEVKKRRREFDGKGPKGEPEPVNLPEPEPEEDVKALKARIAELEARIKELENDRRGTATDDARAMVTTVCRGVRALHAKFRHDKKEVEWARLLEIDPANSAASKVRLGKISNSIHRSISRLYEVGDYVGSAHNKILENEKDERLNQVRDNKRKQVPIIWETERARRVLPWEVRIPEGLVRRNYLRETVLTNKVRKFIADDCPCPWGAYRRKGEVLVRFADHTIATGFKLRWGWAA
ncbi:hypothetical protein SB2_06675 [Methylobacterium radiotolerans]|nr:hypothetical protein SB3_31675 [Methylobacterium radiotolerans]KTS10233.1 hypothetical protein SB3_08715 [Methylobacterium radiotolerans]KTS49239.1 hypothetical protein SB2_06675 [Methylobacterium radiotolerans]